MNDKTKHTPGPWLREGQTVYALMHAGWCKGVEQLKNRFSAYVMADKECPDEEHEANILLLTAAPELLEALQEMVAGDAEAIKEAEALGVPFPEEMLAAFKKARAAIARATGETA